MFHYPRKMYLSKKGHKRKREEKERAKLVRHKLMVV
jgi:hypothetical protein